MQRPHAALALAIQLASVAGIGWSTTSIAAEASVGQTRAYNVAPGTLAEALSRFASVSGLALSFDAARVKGLNSPGLQGQYSVDSGFAALLAGSGLQVVRQANGVYVLVGGTDESGALELGATNVDALGLGQTTEGSGSYTTGITSSATKLPLTLRQTPQSVTVVTRQQMDDQGSQDIGDVLRNTPGISQQAYDSERMEYSTRGFAITNYQYDGINTVYDGVYDEGTTHVDMATFDRVEVIKGATGLMTGSGDPSATVNLVRKKPTNTFKGSLSASAGSWDDYRTQADLSGPINDSGSVRGRVVGAYQDRKSYQDHYKQKKDVFYGILEADVTPDTLLTFGIDKQSVTPRGSTWTGNPVYFADGSRTDFSRSFNPGADWSRRDFDSTTYFAGLEQALANDWKLKLNLDQKTTDHDTRLASASGGNPDPVSGEGMFLYWGRWEGHRVQNTADINLSGPFSLGGRQHELVAGVMASHSRQTGATFDTSAFSMVPGSIFEWNGNLPEQTFPKNGKYERTQSQNGVYLATRLRPTDDLSVILGSRLSTFKYNEDYRYNADSGTDDTHASYQQHGVVTPYAGIVYDLDEVYSVYASYTSIYQPQIYKDINGATLEPVEGDAYEAGLKAAYLDGRLNASLAVFRIEQDNVAESIGTNPITNEGIYKAIDGATTQGIELELAGELSAGWNLSAGYTYARTRDQDEQRIYGYPLTTTKPEHVVRVFTTYRLPGVLDQVTVGGGISYQSSFYGQIYSNNVGDYTRIKQGGYSLVDLMTRYQYNEHLSFTVNANNVTDKRYLSGLGNFDTTYYGEPRNVMLTTKWEF
ncbi:outer membrane receptor for ferric coprogen and ferric-rhodotorulic acid [Pseudomonas hunanensis]|uniref:Outer membrane receptor for ferric coprogen and ferric-rhodotorulic acid n=1 Tax=Pseudomonas hunanensis TaxID=1247546 RepID=A0ACC6K5N5_9PSED|nr:TonB-dependent siderophore receptor [Pseudomonas hunanensis]MDR6713720.1 outer membrane receptor for ferric coprogen and ferric-rhodotorulic acid [Pseudomonas hunanensis]